MGSVETNAKVKKATISAVVTRKDGTKEDLGVIASYSRNPVARLWSKCVAAVKKAIKAITR